MQMPQGMLFIENKPLDHIVGHLTLFTIAFIFQTLGKRFGDNPPLNNMSLADAIIDPEIEAAVTEIDQMYAKIAELQWCIRGGRIA
jgi:hypothetical protein